MSTSIRHLKRQWLQAIGEIGPDPLQPSTSTLTSQNITSECVDSTLGVLAAHDAAWVTLACLDVVERGMAEQGPAQRALQKDAGLLDKIVQLGQSAAESATDPAREHSAEVSDVPEAKQNLEVYSQRLETWKRLYGAQHAEGQAPTISNTTSGDAGETGEQDDYDAWAEVEEATPSPEIWRHAAPPAERTSPLVFISRAPADHAMQLAASDQPYMLVQLLGGFDEMQYLEVFARRWSVIRTMLETRAVNGSGDVADLLKARILPTVKDAREDGLWVDLLQGCSSAPAQLGASRTTPLTEDEMIKIYPQVIIDIAETYDAVRLALSLARAVSSDQIGLPVPPIRSLVTDLSQLIQLVHSAASADDVRTWSLSEYRQASQRASDEDGVAKLAAKFVQGAQDGPIAITAFAQGALPYMQGWQDLRDGHAIISVPDIVTLMLLRLAQSGSLGIVMCLLDEGAAHVTGLDSPHRAKIILALVLGLDMSKEAWQKQRLNALLHQVIEPSRSDEVTISLRDHFGALLSATKADERLASVYAVLERADNASLAAYLDSCSALIDALLRMHAVGITTISFTWLLQLENDAIKQRNGLKTIVGSLAASSPPAYKYSDLSATLMECVGKGKIFDQLSQQDIVYGVAEGAARAGNARTFWDVLTNEDDGVLTAGARETLLYDAVVELHRRSSTANVRSGDTKAAYDLLQSAPEPLASSPRLQHEKAFVEAASRLNSYHVPSGTVPGAAITPAEIRDCADRLHLIRRVLSVQEDAYKAGDIISDLAKKLCAIGSRSVADRQGDQSTAVITRSEVECRTLGMLCEAAMAAGDYKSAQASCERLVADVTVLAKRAEQVGARHGSAEMQQPQEQYITARDVAHRTCHQLAKQPDWDDYASRLRWAALALAYCPPEQLGRYLGIWRDLAKQLETSSQADPMRALLGLDRGSGLAAWAGSNGASASTGAVGGQLSSGLSAALQQARSASSHASATHLGAAGLAAISQLGGSIESYANPLGALFSRAPTAMRPLASSAQESRPEVATKPGSTDTSSPAKVDERTARLFDGLGGGNARTSSPTGSPRVPDRTPLHGSDNHPAYLDPAERAARAARRFFGGH